MIDQRSGWGRRSVLAGMGASALSLWLPVRAADNLGECSPLDRKRAASENQSYVTEITNSARIWFVRWDHRGRPVDVHFEAPDFSSGYLRQIMAEKSHRHQTSLYMDMARNDPFRTVFLWPLVDAVVRRAYGSLEPDAPVTVITPNAKWRFDPADLLLTLVQGIPYICRRRYQAWPSETLLDNVGDCSDTSVLYAALLDIFHEAYLDRFGCDPIWMFMIGRADDRHMAVGLREHSRFSYKGSYFDGPQSKRRYYFCETTGTGWEIGGAPRDSLLTAKETDRIKVSNSITGAVHGSGCRGARFNAETAVNWKLNLRHPPKRIEPPRWSRSAGCT